MGLFRNPENAKPVQINHIAFYDFVQSDLKHPCPGPVNKKKYLVLRMCHSTWGGAV